MLSGYVKTNSYDGRYYQLDWTATQSITDNTSTISWTLSAKGGNSGYYYEHSVSLAMYGEYRLSTSNSVPRYKGTVASGSFEVTHNTSGDATFNIKLEVACYSYSVNLTASKYGIELDTIPRKATITKATDFNDEENPTINYNNPAGSAVTEVAACISLTGSDDDIVYRAIPKTGTSYTFELSEDERNLLLSNTNSGSNSRTIKFYIRTVIGDSRFYDKVTKTFTVTNNKPTISVSASPDTTTMQVNGYSTKTFIKSFTDVSYKITPTVLKGASVVSYSVTCGKQTLNTQSGVLTDIESGTINFSFTDSRGNTATTNITGELIDYIKLTCNLVVDIPTTDGETTLNISGNYKQVRFGSASGAQTNGLRLQYKYIEDKNDSGWIDTTATATFENDTFSIKQPVTGLDYKKKYVFVARAIDIISTVESAEYPVKTLPVFDWGEDDFNFNVPVTIQGFDLGGLIAAFGQSYSLTTTATPATNYTEATGSATLVGNSLRVIFNATRSSNCSVGDIVNEEVVKLNIKHNGKLTSSYNVAFTSASGGGVCSYITSSTTGTNTLELIVKLNATTVAGTKFSGAFVIPVLLNLNKFSIEEASLQPAANTDVEG